MKKLSTLLFALLFTAGIAFGQDHDATISSTGNNNNAQIEQSSTDGSVADIDSDIKQVGDRNTARTFMQRNDAFDTKAITYQEQRGNDNRALINQGDEHANTGIEITQVQVGQRNFANSEGAANYNASQRQVGDDNIATAKKSTKGGDVYQNQVGNQNRATVSGTKFANVYQEQFGNRNTADLGVINHISDLGDEVEGYTTYQNGDDNLIRLNAGGTSGVLDVSQTGNRNTAKVDWSGSGTPINSSSITQNGNDNYGSITQN